MTETSHGVPMLQNVITDASLSFKAQCGVCQCLKIEDLSPRNSCQIVMSLTGGTTYSLSKPASIQLPSSMPKF
jgi:hypothetical protein